MRYWAEDHDVYRVYEVEGEIVTEPRSVDPKKNNRVMVVPRDPDVAPNASP